jgi:DNA helicase HerA-like ATPase
MDFITTVNTTYTFNGISVPLGLAIIENQDNLDSIIRLPLSTLNRHGLIAGATGTGKTKTLQMLAEQFSRNGVPSILMDLKGDLSGLAIAGDENKKVEERKIKLKENYPFNYEDFPVNFLSLGDDIGLSLKAQLADFGSVLLAKILNLNNVQTGIISIVFKYCTDKKLPIKTLHDLKFILTKICNNDEEIQENYGSVPSASVATILRNIAELEEQGANEFIKSPSFDIADFMMFDKNGKGYLSIIRLTKIQDKPSLFSTFILYLLTTIYNTLPEIGDLEKPKLVLFIDEAHLLFDKSNKTIESKLESVIKLIRSKGVSIIFCTQTPIDISASVLGQLGFKIQHALRAFTPKDRKAVKLMAENFPVTNFYNLEEDLTTLAIGEAFITVLNEKGVPTPVIKTMLAPPVSRMGILTDEELTACVNKSPVFKKYPKQKELNIHVSKELIAYGEKLENTKKQRIEKQEKAKEKIKADKVSKSQQIKKPTKSDIKLNPLMNMFSNMMGMNSFNGTNQSINNSVQYYYVKDGQRIGPYSENDIFNFISTGQIHNQTYLWKTGMSGWLLAEQFLEFNLINK